MKIWQAALLVILFGVCCRALDPVNDLIDQEKLAREAWSDDTEDLPAAFFWGDAKGINIYSAVDNYGGGNLVCEPMEFDELIELSRGDLDDRETVLNIALPRVQEILKKTCLIRPKDSFFAIGENWQKRVVAKDFVVKKDRMLCPQDSPYSLWVSLEEPLEEEPLFFSTSDDYKEGSNNYAPPQPVSVIDVDGQIKKGLSPLVTGLSDYKIEAFIVKSTDTEKIFYLKRKTISPDDDKLGNEVLVWKKGGAYGKLWAERVDLKQGSGHVRLKGSLDFNGDGYTDFVVEGDHAKCPYRMVLQGEEKGFATVDLPIKPCSCW